MVLGHLKMCLIGRWRLTTSLDSESSWWRSDLNLRKITIWMSKNCQKCSIFSKKLSIAFFLLKRQNFAIFLKASFGNLKPTLEPNLTLLFSFPSCRSLCRRVPGCGQDIFRSQCRGGDCDEQFTHYVGGGGRVLDVHVQLSVPHRCFYL